MWAETKGSEVKEFFDGLRLGSNYVEDACTQLTKACLISEPIYWLNWKLESWKVIQQRNTCWPSWARYMAESGMSYNSQFTTDFPDQTEMRLNTATHNFVQVKTFETEKNQSYAKLNDAIFFSWL